MTAQRREVDPEEFGRSVELDTPKNAVQKTRYIRRQRWPEVGNRIDPETIAACPDPPKHLATAMRDYFGTDSNIKLVFHQWFKRWCFMERVRDGLGRTGQWRIVTLFHDEPQEGVLPIDLDNGDGRYEYLRGKLGAYREPTARDFDVLSKVDLKRHSVEEVVQYLERSQEAMEQTEATAKYRQDEAEGFLDYAWNAARDDANRAAGSGWHMESTPNRGHVELDPKAVHYRTVQRNGYVERVRVGSLRDEELKEQERLAEEQRLLAARLEEERVVKAVEDFERRKLQEAALRATRAVEEKKGRTL